MVNDQQDDKHTSTQEDSSIYLVPYSPEAVANCFFARARALNQRLTNLRLQKLIYFAHGFYLATTSTSLISEEFEAWQYGPVLRSLYTKLRGYKDKPIDITSLQSFDEIPAESVAEHAIELVLRKFASTQTMRLVDISHAQGSPWEEARNRKATYISNDSIRRYFLG